jgi:3-isopropylmalate dehydrogenase
VKAKITVLGGDGIGPEVVEHAVAALKAVAQRWGHSFELREAKFGGCAIDATGEPLPDETLEACCNADAVLLGAVGGPKWEGKGHPRPESGLLGLRKALGLYANLRPVKAWPALIHASPLRPELVAGVDLIVVRELTGGIYFGKKQRDGDVASDLCTYSVLEVERIVRVAGRIAQKRKRKICSVDKANVLETSRLWREVATRVLTAEFPDVELSHQLVDSCAMLLVRDPSRFDVIVTENLFGDILSDEAAVVPGSLGMLPSASLGDGTRGLYEPIHGSAPDIAGKGIANPYGTILSAAMLLRSSLGLEKEAVAIESAVATAISQGALTGDIAPKGQKPVGSAEAGAAVLRALSAA